MEQLEQKYRDEVRKNSGLLDMNEQLMRRADLLNEFVGELYEVMSRRKFQEEHEFDEEELAALKKLVVDSREAAE